MITRPPLRVLALATAAFRCSMGAARAVERQPHLQAERPLMGDADARGLCAPALSEVMATSRFACGDLVTLVGLGGLTRCAHHASGSAAPGAAAVRWPSSSSGADIGVGLLVEPVARQVKGGPRCLAFSSTRPALTGGLRTHRVTLAERRRSGIVRPIATRRAHVLAQQD